MPDSAEESQKRHLTKISSTQPSGTSSEEARQQFLERIAPETKSAKADLVLFGSVYAPPAKLSLWGENYLGGCSQQPQNIDLGTSSAPEKVGSATRSALVKLVSTGLIAACNREQTDDWLPVARIADVVAPFIEKEAPDLSHDDFMDVEEHLFALAYTRYAKTGDVPWLDRASRAAKVMNANKSSDDTYLYVVNGLLGLINLEKFQSSGSIDALKSSIDNLNTARSGAGSWKQLVEAIDKGVSPALITARARAFQGVTDSLIEDATKAEVEYYTSLLSGEVTRKERIEEPEALTQRCWFRAIAGYELEQALLDCNESLKLKPHSGDTFNSRALVQLRLGSLQGAIEDYNSAIVENAKDAGSLYGRGVARTRAGDDVGGRADIAAALALDSAIGRKSEGYGLPGQSQ